jgi:hypothetical protein
MQLGAACLVLGMYDCYKDIAGTSRLGVMPTPPGGADEIKGKVSAGSLGVDIELTWCGVCLP